MGGISLPGDLPDPGAERTHPAVAGGFFTAEPPYSALQRQGILTPAPPRVHAEDTVRRRETGRAGQALCGSMYMGRPGQAGRRHRVGRQLPGWGSGEHRATVQGAGAPVWADEGAPHVGGGDGNATTCALSVTELSPRKHGYDGELCYVCAAAASATHTQGFPDGSATKNPPATAGDAGSIPGSGRSPWRRKRQPTPVFLPGEFHGQRSLQGYSPWGHRELDTTE